MTIIVTILVTRVAFHTARATIISIHLPTTVLVPIVHQLVGARDEN